MYKVKDVTGNLFDAAAPKKPTNLSINSDLLQKAKSLRINLSQALEDKLVERLMEERQRQWRKENQAALAEYNDFVAENGVFSDGLRRF